MKGLGEIAKRVKDLTEEKDPVTIKETPEVKLNESSPQQCDVFRTTVLACLENAPEGTGPEALGASLFVAIQEAASEVGEDSKTFTDQFAAWLRDLGESTTILSESVDEDL